MSIVPSSRLLWLVFYIALVAAGAGPLPQLGPVWLLALGVVALVALADAALSLRRAQLPVASVPSVARFLRDRTGTLAVAFENPAGRPQRVRVALGLPAAFSPVEEEMSVELPAGTGRSRIEWRCTPHARGRFAGAVVCVEGDSRLGLWHVRSRREQPCDLRVHANLLGERRPLAALFLARGRPGARAQRTVGRGREFEKLRDYLPGDGFDEIHWKATAKRGRPVTKVFQAERTQEIYVVVDASRLSARPVVYRGIAQTVLERYVTTALTLLIAAERQGDRFGLVVHDDRVRLSLRAGHGPAHYAACREAMLGLRPSEATPDVPEIMRHLRAQFRRRALLFFLSDLSDPVLAEDFARHAGVLARQHLLLVGQLRAPEIAPLFAGEEVATNDDIYRRLAGHARWAELAALARKMKPLGVTTLLLDDETMAAQLIEHYLQVKRRQAL
jgi:uncharacterized protein (DUF58 family)